MWCNKVTGDLPGPRPVCHRHSRLCTQELFSIGLFFFSSRRRHTRFDCDWSSDVCSSDLVGTMVAEGKELREFDGKTYVMERSLVPDVSLVKAHRADKSGNLQFRLTARNFNPAAATAGKVCIVEVEEVVEVGEIAPDDIHLPGIYVHRIVHNPNPEKRIEKRTITEKQGA